MGVQLFAGKYFKVRANVFQDNQKNQFQNTKKPITRTRTQENTRNQTKQYRKVVQKDFVLLFEYEIQAAIN